MSSSNSVIPAVASMITRAISAFAKTSFAFFTRFAPNSPSSSSPGVSIITTGPNGRSSIALYTGSVVVPLTSDTIANS